MRKFLRFLAVLSSLSLMLGFVYYRCEEQSPMLAQVDRRSAVEDKEIPGSAPTPPPLQVHPAERPVMYSTKSGRIISLPTQTPDTGDAKAVVPAKEETDSKVGSDK